MCICFFYINNNDKQKPRFVLYFNREENKERQTIPLSYFENNKEIIGGRDVSGGGTWLGLNKITKNISFLTNLKL